MLRRAIPYCSTETVTLLHCLSFSHAGAHLKCQAKDRSDIADLEYRFRHQSFLNHSTGIRTVSSLREQNSAHKTLSFGLFERKLYAYELARNAPFWLKNKCNT